MADDFVWNIEACSENGKKQCWDFKEYCFHDKEKLLNLLTEMDMTSNQYTSAILQP